MFDHHDRHQANQKCRNVGRYTRVIHIDVVFLRSDMHAELHADIHADMHVDIHVDRHA